MKFDMHCHTKEGSMDGKVPVIEFAEILRKKGFDGMLVSDHNSYNGYRAWENAGRNANQDAGHPDLDNKIVVLKGIEYDTIDAGHILVIMPTGVKLKILELRGLPVLFLIEIVHRNGGILGPAHPCGEKYLSITNTRKHRNQLSVMDRFDFLEGFNACETPESNKRAQMIAGRFNKPVFGGSDAHKEDCIGLAYTEFDGEIRNETDLISYVKNHNSISSGGSYYSRTTKERLGKVNKVLVYSFWLYNRMGSLFRHHNRRIELDKLQVRHH